jgi:hypothetical protein
MIVDFQGPLKGERAPKPAGNATFAVGR